MIPADERRVQEIFQEAADLPVGARSGFIAAQCGDRTDIGAKVSLLLEHLDEDVPLPVEPLIYPTSPVHPPAATSPPPQTIGRYRVVRVIGQGGMGIVYEAVQENPQRTVALKVIRTDVGSFQTLERFKREAEVLGRLNHPGIASIYEAGTVELDGRGRRAHRQPFFAMEFVRGVTLAEYLRVGKLTKRDKLELLAAICDAVEHAHQHGVVHRDLKPDNILITEQGRPKVLDFGVARATDPDARSVTLQTSVGQLLGTVPYMSPEQIAGDSRLVDARSDVYSLGVILYEMLTGRLPHDVRHRSIAEAARIISEDEPTNVTAFDTSCRGDIETIVLRAIEKEPERRYVSAAALAADLRRHLNDEPILARPATRVYQLRKFARRNRVLVGGVLATMITLALGAGAATVLAVIASDQRDIARHEAYLAGVVAAEAAWQLGDVGAARESLDAVSPENHDWEWHYLDAQLDRSIATLDDHTEQVSVLDFHAERRLLASASIDKKVRIWHVSVDEIGVPGFELLQDMDFTGWASAIAFSRDGGMLAVANTTVNVWDVATGTPLAALEGHTEKVGAVAFSPDGALIASGGGDRIVRVWDTATQAEQVELSVERHHVMRIFFMADGNHLVAATSDGVLHSWDTATWQPLQATRIAGGFRTLVRAPARDRFVATHAHRISTWDLHADEPEATIERLDQTFDCGTWAGSEQLVLTGCSNGALRLWNLKNKRLSASWSGHRGNVRSLMTDTAGDLFFSACNDSTVKVWSPRVVSGPAVFRRPGGRPAYVRFAPDGELLVVKGPDGRTEPSVTFWNGDRAGYRGFALEGLQIRDVLFTIDGRELITGSADGSLRVCDAVTGDTRLELPGHDGPIWSLALDASGRRVATGGRDHDVRLWDVVAGKAIETLDHHTGGVWSVAFSPDDSTLASIATDGTVVLRDLARGTNRVLQASKDVEAALWGFDLSFHPDGTLLAASFSNPWSSTSGFITVWDVATGDVVATMDGLMARVDTLEFSPSGSRLAAGLGGGVRLFDTATWRAVAMLRTSGRPERLAYSADGNRLAAGLDNGDVVIWDTESAPGRLRRVLAAEQSLAEVQAEVDRRRERLGSSESVVQSLIEDMALEPAIRRAATRLAAGAAR